MNIIKDLREKSGLTQKELAKKASLSLRTIQRAESSEKGLKGYTLVALSEAFSMTPADMQKEFNKVTSVNNLDLFNLRFINLSVLSFLGIPFGNIIVPLILWRRNRSSELVDEIGRRIINFQIIFSILLSFLLSVSPLLSRLFFSNASIVLIVFFLAYAMNVIMVSLTAIKLHRNNYDVLDLPLRFI